MVETREEWKEIIKRSEDTGADGLELNFGCPHGMSERGMGSAVGQVPEYIEMVTRWCKAHTRMPVIVKLTPNITDIQNPYVIDRGNFAGAFFGLVAKWKLDFAGTNARVKSAKAEIESLRQKTSEAKLGIELEVNALYEQLQDAKRRVNSWTRAEKESRKWFVSAGQGYEVGTQDSRDFVDAISAYFGARSNRLMATAEYNLAIAALERATNMPMVSEKGWRPADCEE